MIEEHKEKKKIGLWKSFGKIHIVHMDLNPVFGEDSDTLWAKSSIFFFNDGPETLTI